MIKILFSNASFGGQTHSDVCSSYLQCDKLNKYMKIALGTGDFVRAMLRSQIFRVSSQKCLQGNNRGLRTTEGKACLA